MIAVRLPAAIASCTSGQVRSSIQTLCAWPYAGAAISRAAINRNARFMTSSRCCCMYESLPNSARSPPAGALAQLRVGGSGLLDDLLCVQRCELAAALEDAAVDHHGIDVSRLRRGHDHVRRVSEYAEIEIARRHHNEIGALARLDRADLVIDTHRA